MNTVVTDEMFDRSVVNRGNLYRIEKLISKAEKGEEITYVSLGGSITQGAAASSSETCYASLVAKYLENRFPHAKINFINAGIGATGSLIGVHRLARDVLAYKPDFVTVEFSVNDCDDKEEVVRESYDNLLYSILSSESTPALLLIATVNGDTIYNREDVHTPIAKHYDLPFVSLRRLIDRELESGKIVWREIARDALHPLDEGMAVIAAMVGHFLDSACSDVTDKEYKIPSRFSNDIYKDATIMYAEALPENGNFTYSPEKTCSFGGTLVAKCGEPIEITLENCRRAFLLYMRTPKENAGRVTVKVGEREYDIDASFENGWGSYAKYVRIFDSEKPENIRISIVPNEGEDKELKIFGIMHS